MNIIKHQIRKAVIRWVGLSPLESTLCVLIVVVTFWSLCSWLMGCFLQPSVWDEGDYIARGNAITHYGLLAISDGYRPPLFPAWISLLALLFPEYVLLDVVRFFNILFMSLVPMSWWLVGLKRTGRLKSTFLIMALLTAVWPPFFLYSFKAIAESGSFLLLNILLITLLGYENDKALSKKIGRAFLISLELSMLFLLKANNLLVAVPVALFVFFTLSDTLKNRLGVVSVMATATIILISPWLLFLYHMTGQFKITTTGGMNALIGTGYDYLVIVPHPKALPHKYLYQRFEADLAERPSLKHQDLHKQLYERVDLAERPSLLSLEHQNLLLSATKYVSNSEQNTIERAHARANYDSVTRYIAIQIWQGNMNEQMIHGILKIAHTYGFSMRGGVDLITMMFLIFVIIGSILAWKESTSRKLIMLHWGFALCGMAIAFFWLGNIRFKTYYFDTTGLLVVSIALNQYYRAMLAKFPKIRKYSING